MRSLRLLLPLAILAFPRVAAAQAEKPRAPIRIGSGVADIVMLEPSGAAYVHADSTMVALVLACRRVTLVHPADSARLVRAPLRHAEGGAVTIVVLPHSGERLDCKSPLQENQVAIARGVRLTLDTVRARGSTITEIALRRGGEVLPGDRAIGPAIRFTPLGTLTESRGVAQVSVGFEAFAPDAAGVPNDLEIEVTLEGEAAPLRVRIPEQAILELWERRLRERAREAASRRANPSLHALLLPVPRDPALRAARRLYDGRKYPEAQDSALIRLEAGGLRRADRLSARIQLALTALAHADTLAARIHFQHAVAAEPCVALGANTPEGARALLASIRRPAGACEPIPLHWAAFRGAVRPGAGHPTRNRPRVIGYAAVGAIGLALLGGWQADVQATKDYEAYLRFSPSTADQNAGADAAARAYDRAVASQRRSDGLVWLAAVGWGVAIVDGVVSELSRRDEIPRLQRYGDAAQAIRSRSGGVSTIARPGRVGLALRFF